MFIKGNLTFFRTVLPLRRPADAGFLLLALFYCTTLAPVVNPPVRRGVSVTVLLNGISKQVTQTSELGSLPGGTRHHIISQIKVTGGFQRCSPEVFKENGWSGLCFSTVDDISCARQNAYSLSVVTNGSNRQKVLSLSCSE